MKWLDSRSSRCDSNTVSVLIFLQASGYCNHQTIQSLSSSQGWLHECHSTPFVWYLTQSRAKLKTASLSNSLQTLCGWQLSTFLTSGSLIEHSSRPRLIKNGTFGGLWPCYCHVVLYRLLHQSLAFLTVNSAHTYSDKIGFLPYFVRKYRR